MRTTAFVLAFLCTSAWVSNSYAKRAAPKEVPPVSHEGVRYQVVHFKFQNGHQNGGYLEAISEKDGTKKWGILLYLVEYDFNLENHDCFIASLRLDKEKKKLIVTSEARNGGPYLYYVDLTTRKVMHVIPPRRR